MKTSLRTCSIARAPRWLAALTMIVLLVPAATAQTAEDALRFSHRTPAFGARAMGMGGATFGGVADQSALLSNPAGLAYFQHSLFSGTLNTLSTLDNTLYSLPGATSALEGDVRNTGLTQFAYIAKAPTTRGSLVLGAAYNQTGTYERLLNFEGLNGASSMTDYLLPTNTGGALEYRITRLEAGADPELFDGQYLVDSDAATYLIDFDPDGDGFINRPLSLIAFETFAVDFSPELFEQGVIDPFLQAVATGTVRQTGRIDEEGSMREFSFGGAAEVSKGVMFGLSGSVSWGGYNFRSIYDEFDVDDANDGTDGTTDFDNLSLEEFLETDLVGLNLRAGFSAEAMAGLRFGLSIETPTYYSIDDQYGTTLTTFFDNGDQFTAETGVSDFEYEILTPWRLGAGLVFDVGDVTATADAEFVDWTQTDFRSDLDPDLMAAIDRDIDDTFQAVVHSRFGLEYRFGPLAVRGGFAYQPDPRQTEDLILGDGSRIQQPDRSRVYYSAGIGYKFGEAMEFNFGWMQEQFEDQYLPYVLGSTSTTPVVNEEVVRDRFAVGIQVYF